MSTSTGMNVYADAQPILSNYQTGGYAIVKPYSWAGLLDPTAPTVGGYVLNGFCALAKYPTDPTKTMILTGVELDFTSAPSYLSSNVL